MNKSVVLLGCLLLAHTGSPPASVEASVDGLRDPDMPIGVAIRPASG